MCTFLLDLATAVRDRSPRYSGNPVSEIPSRTLDALGRERVYNRAEQGVAYALRVALHRLYGLVRITA